MIRIKYGNTNTFFVPGDKGGLLFDTDYAGTLPAFYKAINQNDISVKDIGYILDSHYHPYHIEAGFETSCRGCAKRLPP